MTEFEWMDEMQHGNPETCWIRISQLRTEIPVLVCSWIKCLRCFARVQIVIFWREYSRSSIKRIFESYLNQWFIGIWGKCEEFKRNIRHDSSCVLGGPRERRWKLTPNRWKHQRLQAATYSRVDRTRVCCKPHAEFRCNRLQGGTSVWVQHYANCLCFSHSRPHFHL